MLNCIIKVTLSLLIVLVCHSPVLCCRKLNGYRRDMLSEQLRKIGQLIKLQSKGETTI